MQIFGFGIIIAVVAFGFLHQQSSTIGYFDLQAMLIIVFGSIGATLIGSKPKDFVRTFTCLREFLPFTGRYATQTSAMETERHQIEELWVKGKRSEAVQIAEKSDLATTSEIMQQVAGKVSSAHTENRFTALAHAAVDRYEACISNWEMMAKLGPSFGMVGTITGMVRLFKNFTAGSADLGSSMSLALLATLYGITFGAGFAGPISNFLNKLMYERLNVISRCEKTTRQLVQMRE